MSDLSGSSLIGRTISHYRVIAPLGAGGMGVVYRGEDVRLGRPVAIKFIAEELANDPQAVGRLRAEARAASALNHPNICTIHDIGDEGGHPFIVMELMEGQTLRERLSRGLLRVHELLDLGIQTADALHGAHSEGIVHRDIKPANIFLTDRGQVKILDFGLAKSTTAERPGPDSVTIEVADRTAVGTTLGTVAYMSPEQATGEELDGRTDLFSLGVVLYECATGRQPFEGKTHAVILSAILNRAPTPPGSLNPDLPQRLQDVITTCLEKDRELRYQSAADLRADLKRIRRDIESGRAPVDSVSRLAAAGAASVPSTPVVSSGVAVSAATPAAAAASAHAAAPRDRSKLLVGGALALIALIGAGGYALWRRAPETSPDGRGATSQTAAAIDSRVSLAQSSLEARDYRAARSYAAEVLALDPNQAAALVVQREAAAALARFDESATTARTRLAAGDLQGASQALAVARDIDPTAPAVSELGAEIAARTRGVEPAPLERTPRTAAPPAAPAAAQPARPPAQEPVPARRPADRQSLSPTTSAAPATPEPAPAAAPSVEPQARTPNPAPVSTNSEPPAPPAAARPTAPPPPPPAPQAVASRSGGATPDRPPSPPVADDDAVVRRVVADYGRAIETKDLALFRAVKPNLSREEERRLQEGFRAVTSQRVSLTILSVDVRDQAASVVAQRRDVVNAGGRQQTVQSRQTFRLTRTASGWVIDDIR